LAPLAAALLLFHMFLDSQIKFLILRTTHFAVSCVQSLLVKTILESACLTNEFVWLQRLFNDFSFFLLQFNHHRHLNFLFRIIHFHRLWLPIYHQFFRLTIIIVETVGAAGASFSEFLDLPGTVPIPALPPEKFFLGNFFSLLSFF